MNDSVRAAFDMIHAGADIKENTKEFLRGIKSAPARRPAAKPVKQALAFAMVFAVCILAGGWVFFTPVSAISIDINPSLELEVNRFNRVVNVIGCNEDGKVLAQSLNVKFLYYEKALKEIFAVTGQESDISIVVSCDDTIRCGEMLKAIQACTNESSSVYCHTGSMQEAASAHEAGMSCGRYRAYLELKELLPEITEEEVQGMTMKEIYEQISSLSGTEYTGKTEDNGQNGSDACEECEDNSHKGNGHHYGNGGGHHGGH